MPKNLNHFIWYEKHRPDSLNKLSLDPTLRSSFQSYIDDTNIPHLLFVGPRGSGKTTVAFILLNEIPNISLILNASSSDRGIDTIKGKVKNFAKSLPPEGKIKIVFLDEADGLTGGDNGAQIALKNTMEKYSKNCRFILTCNHIDKIIPEIQSRCINYNFQQFPKAKLIKGLLRITKKEGIKNVTKKDIKPIVKRFYPDVRTIVNELQSACLDGSFNPEKVGVLKLDPEAILDSLRASDVKSLRTMLAGQTDFVWLYRMLFDTYIDICKVDDKRKAEIAVTIADYLSKDTTIPDREINFVACCIELMEGKLKW